ncbi:MAG: putative addiction module antidote protein [Burkholderiales bacterium]|nr:putative addiction module antidote protein [Burkholderiales bacterium]
MTMKTLKVKTLSVDDFIRDDEAAAVYLNEMMKQDEGDGSLVRIAIGDIVKCRNVSELAKTSCVSRASLYKAFNKNGNPSFEMTQKVLAAMGIGIRFVPLNKSQHLTR